MTGPAVGAEFAGHRIETVLGTGGMGVVYRAHHLALDRARALKVLSPAISGDDRFRERFRRESRLAASIEHPNVIPVHEAGELEGHLYLSMRLVEGDDLRELVLRDGALEPQRAAGIVAGVAAGLDAAHATGLIHRDVKPANVLVGTGADAGRVYLTDFGISRTARAGETLTGAGEIIGTADFVSPEQIAGDPVDHRADVYALGAVLHFALTGSAPFARDNELATLFAHANAPRPRPSQARPGLPPVLDSVVARAMAVDPDDRFGSAGELATALDRALAGIETAPLGREPRARGSSDRGRPAIRTVLATAAVVAIAAAAVLVAADGGDDGGDPAETSDARDATPRTTEIRGLPPGPTGLTVGDLRVWVAARDGATVVGLDLASPAAVDGRVAADVPAPTAVAQGAGSIWAVGSQDALYRLDPAEGTDPATIPLPSGSDPSDVAISGDEEAVWVTLEGTGKLARYEIATGRLATETACEEPRSVAVGEAAAWVACAGDNVLAKFDPAELEAVGGVVEVGVQPTDVAVGEGYVWVTDNKAATLTRVDPGAPDDAAGIAGEPVTGLDRPRGVKAGMGAVWVANAGDDTVRRFDPDSLQPVGEPIPVGAEPADIALGASAAWTANLEDASVTRIDARG